MENSKLVFVLVSLMASSSMAVEVLPRISLPAAKTKSSSRLVELKKNEDLEKWDKCARLASQAVKTDPSLKGWIATSWIRCARKAEAKTPTSPLTAAALKAFDVSADLQVGPWQKALQQEQLRARFQVLEKELKKKPAAGFVKDLDRLLESIEPTDRESKARALGFYGEWAQGQRDLEAARLFFEQSLDEKENRGVREKYAQVLLALDQKKETAKTDRTREEYISDGERKFDERFGNAQKNNDLIALAEDCISYLNRYPNGKRSKWANDKIMELYSLFLDQSQAGEEKWQALRDRLLSLMGKADASRLGEWARLLHRRSDFDGSLQLAEKALSNMGNTSQAGILLYVAGRSAQITGDERKAQKYFENYADAHSSGDDIAEVLFRLGTVHLRQGQGASAVAIFERLLSLKNKDRYELSSRYWMIRALQDQKSPRVTSEIESLLQDFPFSYYGLKLRAEVNSGMLEWPYPLETAKELKGKLALTGPQKKSWERIRVLAASGWRSEALIEAQAFPRPEDPKLKALLAQLWSDHQAYPVTIKLLNDASEDSVDYRTRDLISLGLPKDFSTIVEAEAKKNSLQPILVWSLMRQESAFNPRAVSTSNALGLMQLIPPTAQEMATRLKMGTLDIPDDAFNPERNIPMGTGYLAQMIRYFQASVPVGVAAYNAGPTRMDRFLKIRPKLRDQILRSPITAEDELWMDELPWFETSFYVKAILRNTLMYRLLDQRRVPIDMVVWKDLYQASAAPSEQNPTSAKSER